MPLVILFGVVGLILLLWGWYSSGMVLALPRDPITTTPGDFGLPFDDVSFVAWDGTSLRGWFVPSPQGRDVTIVVCHGRGACRSGVLPVTQYLASRGGFNLLYFDFRNHGESGGRKTSVGRSESLDLEAALDWVNHERPAQSRRVGVYGMSMGAAVAIVTAARRAEIEAVAAESAFTSFNRSIIRYGALLYRLPAWAIPYTLWWIRARLGFNPEESSPERCVHLLSPRPLFLLQGRADVRVPPSEGERLFALAGEPKSLWTVPGADHAALWEMAGREYEDRLLDFFQKSFPI